MSADIVVGKEYTRYGLASTGKVKKWIISVHECDDGSAVIMMQNGYTDGKLATSARLIEAGKNLGKSNETSPLEQALSEAASRIALKHRQGYRETEKELEDLPIGPMLAKTFDPANPKVEFPCFVQPKLNGVRCLAHRVDNNTIEYRSRLGKEFTTLHHLDKALLDVMAVGEVFDGEVYVHGWSFQKIVSAVKATNEDTPMLSYHIFDMVSEITPFHMRLERLYRSLNPTEEPGCTCMVPTDEVSSIEELLDKHVEFSTAGYEGTIIRDPYACYAVGQRSAALQKYKDFVDSEFTISDYKIDAEGGIVFKCLYNDIGDTFDARPTGSLEQRKEWASRGVDYWRGKLLTVKYQNLSEDNCPIFPVGLGVRDYE